MSKTGKALIYDPNEDSKMKWVTDYSPKTPLGKGDVLVKVISAGLNPVDYKLPNISFMWSTRKNTPVGTDICGTVIAVGSDVHGIAVNDVVFGCGYGLAEYAIVPASAVAKAPGGIKDIVPFGSLGVAAGTAYQMLEIGKAFAGTEPKNILVIGASGGVGTYAVQLAKAKCPQGSSVSAVCSKASSDYVKSLGASTIVTYDSPGFMRTLPEKSFDVVIDAVSSPEDYDYVPEGMKLLKDKVGEYVAANTAHSFDWVRMGLKKMFPFNLLTSHYHLMFLQPKTSDFEEIGALVTSGKVKIHVQEYFPFNEEGIKKAFETLKSRRVRGKLVIKM